MAELRNLKWGPFLKGLFQKESLPALTRSHSLQWWLTIGLRKQGFCLIDQSDGIILEHRGVKFFPDPLNYPRFIEAPIRYKLEDVTREDTVFDFGANTGSYSIPCALKGARVYPFEPIFFPELNANILLNHLSSNQIVTFDCAVSEDSVVVPTSIDIDCQEHSKRASLGSVQHHYRLLGPPTVVRLDIGGEEWSFKDLPALVPRTVRLLEVEFHFFSDKQKEKADLDKWLGFLKVEGFSFLGRWSTRKNWFYLSAKRDGRGIRRVVNLIDGSFTGRNLELWKGNV